MELPSKRPALRRPELVAQIGSDELPRLPRGTVVGSPCREPGEIGQTEARDGQPATCPGPVCRVLAGRRAIRRSRASCAPGPARLVRLPAARLLPAPGDPACRRAGG